MSNAELRRFPGAQGVDGVPGPGPGDESGAADRGPGRRVLPDPRPVEGPRPRRAPAEALRRVKIADPERVLDRYPHQLSGGMLQRVVIAMALAGDPKLLVLDEPTTGLDATVEAEVLDLVRDLRSETHAAILLIAHNLGVIRTMCDRVGVMYAGKVVEEGTVQEVFDNPQPPLHDGPAELDPPPRRAQDRSVAVHDPRQPAADRHRPADVRLRRSLPAGRRHCAAPRCRRSSSAAPVTGPGATTPTRSIRSRRPSTRTPTSTSAPTRSCSWPPCPRRSASVVTTCRRWSASTSASRRVRRSVSSASPVPASRRSPRRCSASTSADDGGTIELDGRARDVEGDRSPRRVDPRLPDGVPEPRLGPQPDVDRSTDPAAGR